MPDGVFKVVHGDKEAVDAILHHPGIAAVSFVGSTPIAKYIYETAAANGKRCQALGGAKNHMIVMPDADLDQAADALMGAAYGAAGERCMAISVAVPIGDQVADALIAKLVPRVRGLKIGPGTDREAEMGPLVTAPTSTRSRATSISGVRRGCRARRRRPRLQAAGLRERLLHRRIALRPGHHGHDDLEGGDLRAGALGGARQDYAEAAGLIAGHEFANGTAIFTRDGDAAREFAHQVEVGMVGINVPIPVPMAFHSFGGWKQSLFGDHHMHGPEGVRFYTRLKTITSRWPTGIRAGADFVMPTMR